MKAAALLVLLVCACATCAAAWRIARDRVHTALAAIAAWGVR